MALNKLLLVAITAMSVLIIPIALSQHLSGQDTNVYENSKLGLDVSYPIDWSITKIGPPERPPDNSISFEPRDGSAIIAIHVFTKGKHTIEQIVEESIKDEISWHPDVEIQGLGYIVINGNKAYGFSAVGPKMIFGEHQRHSHNLNLYIDVQNTIYWFYLNSLSTEGYSKALPAYEHVVTNSQLSGIPQGLQTGPTEKNQFNPFGSNS